MRTTDKDRILNFLIGNESVTSFESWVYNNPDLESSVGAELYFELIAIDYKDKHLLSNLEKIIISKFISKDDFERFKYRKHLQDAGWHQGRCINVNPSNFPDTPEIKNAINILEEFGGLKFVSSEKRKNWTLTLVEFFEEPGETENMNEYGLNKHLVSFASAHNDHVVLYVDESNNFYQLDNVVSENLYKYKGLNFEYMMRGLLALEPEDNFHKVGDVKKKNSFISRIKNVWKKSQNSG